MKISRDRLVEIIKEEIDYIQKTNSEDTTERIQEIDKQIATLLEEKESLESNTHVAEPSASIK